MSTDTSDGNDQNKKEVPRRKQERSVTPSIKGEAIRRLDVCLLTGMQIWQMEGSIDDQG